MCQSHALNREGQITVMFTGHSRIMGYQYTGCFILTFWHLEFAAATRFLENLWIPGKVGVPDKTWTGYLQNTRQKHCHLTQLQLKKKKSGKTSWKQTIGTARCMWQDRIKVGLERIRSGLKWLWTGSNSKLFKHDNPSDFLQRQISDKFNNYQLLHTALYHGTV